MSYASLGRPDTEAEQLLGEMTIQALQRRAQALRVDEAALDAAEEKAELVALIGAAQAKTPGAVEAKQQAAEAAEAARLEQLRTELEGTTLRALQQRARQRGVDDAKLGAAADKAALVQLVLDAERPPVVCPNSAEKLDRLLTDRDTGEPTLLFRAAQLSCGLMSAAFCAGTFVTPGLADAIELEGPLLFGALLLLALVAGPVSMLALAEARRVCRCTGEEAFLPRLGAGTALLSAERHTALKGRVGMLDLTSRKVWVPIGIRIVVYGTFLVTGWGVQSPVQNRCTAAAASPGLSRPRPRKTRRASSVVGESVDRRTLR